MLKHLVEKNHTLNSVDIIMYLGHKLSANGIYHLIKIVLTSISMLKPPTIIKELRSFLGMITNFAAPLRSLLKKDFRWICDDKCCNSFNMLKEMLLSSNPSLL